MSSHGLVPTLDCLRHPEHNEQKDLDGLDGQEHDDLVDELDGVTGARASDVDETPERAEQRLGSPHVLLGFLAGVGIMYVTGLLVA